MPEQTQAPEPKIATAGFLRLLARAAKLDADAKKLGFSLGLSVHSVPREAFDAVASPSGGSTEWRRADGRLYWSKDAPGNVSLYCDEPPVEQSPEVSQVVEILRQGSSETRSWPKSAGRGSCDVCGVVVGLVRRSPGAPRVLSAHVKASDMPCAGSLSRDFAETEPEPVV